MPDYGEWLETHTAPDGLLEGALEVRLAPRPRSRYAFVAALAASFLIGVTTDRLLHRAPSPAEPPITEDGVPVRLVIHLEGAQTVSVAGTWNGWSPSAQPLISDGDGTFSTVLMLPRGRHEYLFVVDGESWVLDPSASLVVEDGFGQRNAVLEI